MYTSYVASLLSALAFRLACPIRLEQETTYPVTARRRTDTATSGAVRALAPLWHVRYLSPIRVLRGRWRRSKAVRVEAILRLLIEHPLFVSQPFPQQRHALRPLCGVGRQLKDLLLTP